MTTRGGPVQRVRGWSIARQLFVLQALLALVVVAAVAVAAVVVGGRRDTDAARTEVLGLADSVAVNPLVVRAATRPDPTSALQPYAESLRQRTDVDFVVVMAPDRTRWTHPNTALIGRPFVGTIAPALRGRAFTETYTGSLGPSVRSVVPVRSGGRVVALVSVGITTDAIRERLARQLPYLIGGLAVLLGLALAGSALVGRRLRRQTGGVDAATMAGMLASHNAVLHSVAEGLVVTDRRGRLSLMNAEAARLLSVSDPDAHVGRPVGELRIPASVAELLGSPRTVTGELHLTGERVLVVDQYPARWQEQDHGTVTTLRDRTALESLTGELDATRSLAQSLHSQTHEAANRLHTMIVLMETGRTEDAVRFGTEQLALSQRLTDDTVAAVDEPVVAALLLGKVADAAERGVRIDIEVDGDPPLAGFGTPALSTVLGNLLDNAVDASLERPATGTGRRVLLELADEHDALVIAVSDDGPGLPPDAVEHAFRRGWSTKIATSEAGRGLGLALVHQVVRQHGGEVLVDASPLGGARLTVTLPVPGSRT